MLCIHAEAEKHMSRHYFKFRIMKIFYTMMCMLIASTVFVSCSKENGTPEQENNVLENLNVVNSTKAKGFDYYEANQLIIRDIQENKTTLPLNQATVDYYGDLIGFEGSISAADANKIADEVSGFQEIGMREWLNSKMSFTEFTNNTILQMSNEGPFADLEQLQGFDNLPRNEQEMLQIMNDIAVSYYQGVQGKSSMPDALNRQVDPFWWGYQGAFLGCAVGFIHFGPIGGLIGGIIGGSIGYVAGWVANGFRK